MAGALPAVDVLGRMISTGSMLVGFRFHPTDEELVSYYLKLKIDGGHSEVEVIPEIDVNKFEPWDIPGKLQSMIQTDDSGWYFFCPRNRKYQNRTPRIDRATDAGYWKPTGRDRKIETGKSVSNSNLIGMRKTLVFYKGRAPKGARTNWMMYEYSDMVPRQDSYVICRLFKKLEESRRRGPPARGGRAPGGMPRGGRGVAEGGGGRWG